MQPLFKLFPYDDELRSVSVPQRVCQALDLRQINSTWESNENSGHPMENSNWKIRTDSIGLTSFSRSCFELNLRKVELSTRYHSI